MKQCPECKSTRVVNGICTNCNHDPKVLSGKWIIRILTVFICSLVAVMVLASAIQNDWIW